MVAFNNKKIANLEIFVLWRDNGDMNGSETYGSRYLEDIVVVYDAPKCPKQIPLLGNIIHKNTMFVFVHRISKTIT